MVFNFWFVQFFHLIGTQSTFTPTWKVLFSIHTDSIDDLQFFYSLGCYSTALAESWVEKMSNSGKKHLPAYIEINLQS